MPKGDTIRIGEIKHRDPFHGILTAKSGSSGAEDVFAYKRQKEKQVELPDDFGEVEKEKETEVMLAKIIGEIETWSGQSLGEALEIRQRENLEAAADYGRLIAAALQDLLATDVDYQAANGNQIILKEIAMITGWVKELESLSDDKHDQHSPPEADAQGSS